MLFGLWGVMVYQFLGEEDTKPAHMSTIANPYKNLPPQPAPAGLERAQMGAPDQIPPESRLTTLSPGAAVPTPPSSLGEIRVPDYIKGPASAQSQTAQTQPVQSPVEEVPPPAPVPPATPPTTPPARETPVPVGFIKGATRHFTAYAEGEAPPAEFLELLENLHGNLMLDLSPFSPWARDNRVAIFLFKSQETYRLMTGRPAWSGGASSVPNRRIYLYESAELPGILAHELCHIYYDNFYADGQPDPLWLSEGMATLIQIERGQARPTWLRENLDVLEHGGGSSLEELMSLSSTSGQSDAKVRLWYAQSYSVVRFLIRTQTKSAFFNFSRNLREGRPVPEALYRAYGMPYNRLKALEYAWRYEITTHQLSHISGATPQQP